ncbi:phosphorylated CTD interacting factor 1 WW domain-containing protein [Tetraselmis virus 1]|uniref:Phosphorylated CTD interacting factor 1 WW domain-containing protein n=1 Tax=Tetraselmis virus 1 TaxID=2060617 RepID=A0A2P0VNQ5_9VIRU|nr:phosphorylated CTD interacting factor 1 WW domain-containing protein [Tetraselmis virus 1]AUF82512.1 phosphorylated CTD interacting factor 1 WW domain-containing protein [Tetraselmis virus 1]
MEKEIYRRNLYNSLGENARSFILTQHAINPKGFTVDPVFPDSFLTQTHIQDLESCKDNQDIRIRTTGSKVFFYYKSEKWSVIKHVYNRIKETFKGPEQDFLKTVAVAMYRYETIYMLNGMSASVPPRIYEQIRQVVRNPVECFASLFNHTLPSYHGIFSELEKDFGCLGNFFLLEKPAGFMVCNPPFQREVMNRFVEHLLALIERAEGTALVILPAFDTDDRDRLNDICRCKYPVDYITDVNTQILKQSNRTMWYALYCKESFPYQDMIKNKTICYTSTLVLLISSERDTATWNKVVSFLPKPDIEFITSGVKYPE